MAFDERADPGPRELAGHERHEQLQRDVAQRIARRHGRSLGMNQRGDEQRRQHDADQARERCTAHGRGDIAVSDRRERDRRLHGRRQRAQEQHAERQLRTDQRGRQRLQGQADQWEQRERAQEHEQMQPPVRDAGDDGFARQLRAVHEEQQRDRQLGDPGENHRRLAAARHDARQRHADEQRDREAVEQQGESVNHDGRSQVRKGSRFSRLCRSRRWTFSGSVPRLPESRSTCGRRR